MNRLIVLNLNKLIFLKWLDKIHCVLFNVKKGVKTIGRYNANNYSLVNTCNLERVIYEFLS